MKIVSPQFKAAVYAPSRKTTARVTFDISDVSAADDAITSVTSEAEISRKLQLTNQKRDRLAYGTFEPNYWKLDGSFFLPPKPTEVGYEVGWYSGAFSGNDGTFGTPQVMDFTFTTTHSSIGLTISFDAPANEYAADFDINVYNGSGGVIRSFTVRGNVLSRYAIDRVQLANYKRITVTLLKWCKANRRAKVTEMSFGVVREYEDDNLIKLNLIEEIIPTSETVPANEFKFTIDNSSKEFNILNPNGFYNFLQQRQSTVLEVAVETAPDVYEYVNMGYYFLTDWQSDEGSLTTTFTARNRIDFIPSVEIENLTAGSTNLRALALSIMPLAKITDYRIDVALASITTQGVYKKMTYRQLLQNIAIAGQCAMFIDRTDIFNLSRLSLNTAVDKIDFDNVYREPQIKLDKLVSRVEVNYYNGVTIVGTHILNSAVGGGATLKLENTLINSLTHAQNVATWLLSESDKRALYEVNWRQNPALECGDIVAIEDGYGADKDSRITRQEYEYAGYLSGKTKTKGTV